MSDVFSMHIKVAMNIIKVAVWTCKVKGEQVSPEDRTEGPDTSPEDIQQGENVVCALVKFQEHYAVRYFPCLVYT